MATVSGMGFSGYDYVGSVHEGMINGAINEFWNRRAAKQSAKLNYGLAQRYAENSPSWTRTGLENAGYNPMLAVSGDLSTFGNGNIPVESAAPHPSNTQSGFNAQEFEASKAAKKLVENEVKQSNIETSLYELESEIDYQKLLAEADVYGLNLGDVDRRSRIKGHTSAWDNDSGELVHGFDTNHRYKRIFRNAVERDQYLNSREHALFEDGVSTVHGLSGVGTAVSSAYESHRRNNIREKRLKW